MKKKGQLQVGLFVMLAMAVIIGIVFVNEIFNQQSLVTTKQTSTNDSITTRASVAGSGQVNATDQFTVTNYYGTDDYRNTECPMETVVLTNSTGTEYTVNTDYVFTPAYGNFTLKNTAKVNASVLSNNLTYVTYTYCAEGYDPNAGSRGMLNLVGLLTVLALFIIVASKIQFD